jgi:hypothetical protein
MSQNATATAREARAQQRGVNAVSFRGSGECRGSGKVDNGTHLSSCAATVFQSPPCVET